jgi:putative aminopeptidase FrvX
MKPNFHVPDIEYMTEKLVSLCNIPSPSGDTREAIEWIKSEFQRLGFLGRVTNKGALIVTMVGRKDEPQRAFSAHVDTLGAMVFEIKSNGRLKLTRIGGPTWNSIEGEHVLIKSSSGRVFTGTVLLDKASSHVYGDEAHETKRTEDTMEVRLDEKVKTKEDVMELGIKPGDFVVFDPRTMVTPSGFVKSRHLDDKAAVASLLGVAKYFRDNGLTPAYTTHFFISNFEEVGHGASYGIPQEVTELIAVDMGCVGEGLLGSEYTVSICAKDSNGPYDLELRKKLESVAEENDIPFVVDIFPHYGSDVNAALRAGLDVRGAVIGMGVDASHSHESTHKEGILATARLITSYMMKE